MKKTAVLSKRDFGVGLYIARHRYGEPARRSW